jgi:hypothetical protein
MRFEIFTTMKEKQLITPAKTCYDHIGGKLGSLILEMCLQKGWIQLIDSPNKRYLVTELGQSEFSKLGIDISLIKREAL